MGSRSGAPSAEGGVTVLFEDRHCLAVLKPARLLTAADETGDDTLLARVKRRHAERQAAAGKAAWLAPVHFLDRPVSGVVMFALSSKAAARFQAQFAGRSVEKVYWAVVDGTPPSEATRGVVLEDWLLKDETTNVTRVVPPRTAGAKASVLSYRVLATEGRRSLLEVRPKTGRSHQIRVQLAGAGLPIHGDAKYGRSGASAAAAEPFAGAIALHARRLSLAHPVTKEPLTIVAPLPDLWKSTWPTLLAASLEESTSQQGGGHVQEARA
jgi:23S rRNA pseudouridine1911/1915/1917 synthase